MDSSPSQTRRAFLAACGTTVLAGCSVNSATPPSERPSKERIEWPQFAQNAGKTGHIREVSTPLQMTVEWSTRLGVPRTSPVVVGNTVYLGISNQVVAINAESGKTNWRTTTNGQPIGTPAVKNGLVVYTESQHSIPFEHERRSKRGALRALSADTGEEQWRIPLDGGGFSPTISGGTVYVRTAQGAQAYDLQTGSTRWEIQGLPRFKTNLPPIIPDLAPASAEDRLFVPNPDSLLAINTDTGGRLWETEINQVRAAPAVANGIVYVSSVGSGVQALDAETGNLNWSWSGAGCWTSPGVSSETVYVTESTDLVALDTETGTEQWRYFIHGDSYSAPAVTENAVIVGSLGWVAAAVKTRPGIKNTSTRKSWVVGKGGTRFSPAFTGDRVFVADNSGQLHALTEN